jgi:hypothetical protein
MTSNSHDLDCQAQGADEVRHWTEHLLSQARAISQTLDDKVRTLLSRKSDEEDAHDQAAPGDESCPEQSVLIAETSIII